jgi:hypothetical protein
MLVHRSRDVAAFQNPIAPNVLVTHRAGTTAINATHASYPSGDGYRKGGPGKRLIGSGRKQLGKLSPIDVAIVANNQYKSLILLIGAP